MAKCHPAQVNIAQMKGPVDVPVMAGFVARLHEINAGAELTRQENDSHTDRFTALRSLHGASSRCFNEMRAFSRRLTGRRLRSVIGIAVDTAADRTEVIQRPAAERRQDDRIEGSSR
jgi:hypothetical protein